MLGVIPKQTTDFDKIKFNETWHRYFYEGVELTSVTKKLKGLQKPFDRDGIANRVAKRQGVPVEQVLADWDAKGEAARNKGTLVHAHIEKALKDQLPSRDNDPFLSINPVASEIDAFNDVWGRIKDKVSVKPHHVEMIVGDSEWGIAGTVDSLIFSRETNLYHIWDWKTGKFDTSNQWENLLTPLNHLDASKLNIYSMQLSLYRLILERNTSLPIGHSYLVHLSANGPMVHKAIDLRSELRDWLLNA